MHTDNRYDTVKNDQVEKKKTNPQTALPIAPPSDPALVREAVSIVSPLRYPGSKRRLGGYIKKIIKQNNLRPSLLVEPFAGGASVALQLLNDRVVEKVGIIDLDPLLASFWKIVFREPEWLIKQIETVEVTLEKWNEFKALQPKNCKEEAMKCLFLNRTSFSGLLTPEVGPIGGREQKSEYKIDCRFPRETLIKRVRMAAELSDKVAFVWKADWKNAMQRIRDKQQQHCLPEDTFWYFDPPYLEKAEQLYTYHFRQRSHSRLRDVILELNDPWVLSYDSAKKFGELYKKAIQEAKIIEMLHSTAATGGIHTAKEILLTNLPEVPSENRIWRKSEEWHKHKSKTIQLPIRFDEECEEKQYVDEFPEDELLQAVG